MPRMTRVFGSGLRGEDVEKIVRESCIMMEVGSGGKKEGGETGGKRGRGGGGAGGGLP